MSYSSEMREKLIARWNALPPGQVPPEKADELAAASTCLMHLIGWCERYPDATRDEYLAELKRVQLREAPVKPEPPSPADTIGLHRDLAADHTAQLEAAGLPVRGFTPEEIEQRAAELDEPAPAGPVDRKLDTCRSDAAAPANEWAPAVDPGPGEADHCSGANRIGHAHDARVESEAPGPEESGTPPTETQAAAPDPFDGLVLPDGPPEEDA